MRGPLGQTRQKRPRNRTNQGVAKLRIGRLFIVRTCDLTPPRVPLIPGASGRGSGANFCHSAGIVMMNRRAATPRGSRRRDASNRHRSDRGTLRRKSSESGQCKASLVGYRPNCLLNSSRRRHRFWTRRSPTFFSARSRRVDSRPCVGRLSRSCVVRPKGHDDLTNDAVTSRGRLYRL